MGSLKWNGSGEANEGIQRSSAGEIKETCCNEMKLLWQRENNRTFFHSGSEFIIMGRKK